MTSNVSPKSIKRILVVTHTNAAIDDVLKKIANMRSFKDNELVRVGIKGSNRIFTMHDVLERRVRRERKSQNVRNPYRAFPEFGLSDIINDASIVFSTFGSLHRREFVDARKRFDMVIIEEAGKLHEGDMILGISHMTGMKDSPEPVQPLSKVIFGDETQLPPYSSLDPNLSFPRLCADLLFKRFVSTCERSPGALDFNYPITLVTQHRAHRAFANLYNHYAYKGIIRTGARESWLKWKADEMDKRIAESDFKFRTVSVVSYDGCLHSDLPGNTSVHGGNTNKYEYMLILNVCKDCCYRSKKFDKRITIVSPYKAQVDKLRSLLAQEGENPEYQSLQTVQVRTVESSQGLENDIVILSLVRPRYSQKQAFLDNPFRINVMLSRGRERLIIVGAREEALAAEEKTDRERHGLEGIELAEGDTEQELERLHYGFYKVVCENKISEPKQI